MTSRQPLLLILSFFFFFNDTATTEIYPLSLHDALPIWPSRTASGRMKSACCRWTSCRSEEHTSELQSPCNLVCRLLLEKKNKNNKNSYKYNPTQARQAATPQQRRA